MIDPELREMIAPHLYESEKLLWASPAGNGVREPISVTYNIFLIGLFLAMLTFIFAVMISGQIPSKTVWVLLSIFGLFCIRDLINVVKSLSKNSKRLSIYYAITSHRILEMKPEYDDFKSYGQDLLEHISRKDKDDVSNFVLTGGDGDIFIEMHNVVNGREAERFLLKYFLKQKEKTNE